MTIVTRTGDNGETGLFGGERVSKTDTRIHAYGTVDELNAHLGVVLSLDELKEELAEQVLRIQNVLFRMGADLATPVENNAAKVPRMQQVHVDELETWIIHLEERLPILQHFILPGGSKTASHFHVARAVTRRAERYVVELALKGHASKECVRYLNRLSDYLFLAALRANKELGIEDTAVRYN